MPDTRSDAMVEGQAPAASWAHLLDELEERLRRTLDAPGDATGWATPAPPTTPPGPTERARAAALLTATGVGIAALRERKAALRRAAAYELPGGRLP